MPETKQEHRSNPHKPEVVKRSEGEGQCVEGYAAVFWDAEDPGSEYWLWEDLCERIDSACFNRAIAEQQPCRCFVNHDPNYRLGRCDKGTLRLKVDSRGLQYSADIPDTQVGKDTAADLANGNLDGSSFSFSVTGQRWEDVKKQDGSFMTIRTITDVDLFDVGPVSIPAYEATTAGLRSTQRREDVIAQRDEWRAAKAAESESVAIRARELEVRARSEEN